MNFLKRLWHRNKNQNKKKEISDVKQWYELVPITQDRGRLAVRIIKGPYKDLVLKYGAVSVKKDEKSEKRSTIRYEYDIVYVPTNLEGKELDEEQEVIFHNFLGDILSDILHAAFVDKSKEVVAEMIDEAEVKTDKK